MKCYKCNAEIQENIQFCPECGARQQITEDLVQRAICKDADAVEQLFFMTGREICFQVRTMVWDEDAAFGLIQESYVKGLKALDKLNNPAGFGRMMKKTATAECLEYLKKNGVLQALSAIPVTADFSDDRGPVDVELSLSDEQIEYALDEYMRAMPAWQQLLVGLYYGQQLGIGEMAELLKISEATVKSGLMQTRQNIRSCYEDMIRKGKQPETPNPAEHLMQLYAKFKEVLFAGIGVLLLAGIRKKMTENKSKRAAKAVGAAAMSVAGESVGEVAKEGIKATLAKIIAGLTATAVIGGGTGVVLGLSDNGTAEQAAVQQTVTGQVVEEQVVEEQIVEEQKLIEEEQTVEEAGLAAALLAQVEQEYQKKVDQFLTIELQDGENNLSFQKSMIGTISDMQLSAQGYLAKGIYSQDNILFVPCSVTLEAVALYDGNGTLVYQDYEDLTGVLKLTNLKVEDGEVVYDKFVDFYGFFTSQELMEETWIQPLEGSYRIETVVLE